MSSFLQSPVQHTAPKDAEAHARSNAWAFIFDCHVKKTGGSVSRPNDAARSNNDYTYREYTR